ncbi:hypothetical protein TomTYG75_07080 [Sphingobium sp. TomTYG75]
MARRNKQLIDNRGRLQRILDAEAAANDAAPVVNPFTAIHGNYKVLSKYGDARKAMVNRGGTPVARWIESGALSDSQMAAINHCERLWGKLNGKSLTQDLNKISGIGGGDGWAEQEALDDLKRIKGYFPMKWWTVFECVCRFDEPAGFAGSALTALRNDQVAAARTTVQFVADIIAMNERLSY